MSKRFLLAVCSAALLVSFVPAGYAQEQDGYGAGSYGNAGTAFETRLTAVEDQMRALTGKVEQVDYAVRRIDQALQRMQEDMDARLSALEHAQQTAAQAAPASPSVSVESGGESPHESTAPDSSEPVAGTLGGMKVRDGQVTGGSVSPKTPALPKKPDDYGLTAQEHYELAFGQLRQADYDKAEKTFKTFIEKYGQDPLIDNAKYWYAETFYVRGKYGDAAIAFADAYQQNAKGNKAPDSLLKLAMSLAAMDKTQDACDALTALKAKYPKAPRTIRERTDQERGRLKCK